MRKNIWVSRQLFDEAKAFAESDGRSFSNLVEVSIRAYIENKR